MYLVSIRVLKAPQQTCSISVSLGVVNLSDKGLSDSCDCCHGYMHMQCLTRKESDLTFSIKTKSYTHKRVMAIEVSSLGICTNRTTVLDVQEDL